MFLLFFCARSYYIHAFQLVCLSARFNCQSLVSFSLTSFSPDEHRVFWWKWENRLPRSATSEKRPGKRRNILFAPVHPRLLAFCSIVYIIISQAGFAFHSLYPRKLSKRPIVANSKPCPWAYINDGWTYRVSSSRSFVSVSFIVHIRSPQSFDTSVNLFSFVCFSLSVPQSGAISIDKLSLWIWMENLN